MADLNTRLIGLLGTRVRQLARLDNHCHTSYLHLERFQELGTGCLVGQCVPRQSLLLHSYLWAVGLL